MLEDYPEIPFALHTSGPLLEWLVERHPEYIARLRRLVESGRVEILGGGFFEPILTMIPHRDRVGQIRGYSRLSRGALRRPGPRDVDRRAGLGAARWSRRSPRPASSTRSSTTFHFLRAGCPADDVLGYYLTEDDGRLLKIFPGSETLRYMIPFHEPHATYEYLRELAERRPGSTVVFADDGEKFGTWPKTFDHVYTQRLAEPLLRHAAGQSRLAGDDDLCAGRRRRRFPRGKIYLPDGSYREMTEWALPPEALARLSTGVAPVGRAAGWRARSSGSSGPAASGATSRRNTPKATRCTPGCWASRGGWRRSRRTADADPDYLEVARQELYRGQCNCPYWHGSFGGLYLPHLRNAIYRSLIAADNALDDAEGRTGPRVALEVADFNLDARQEVRLENDHLIAMVRPAPGGHLYELDVRRSATNVLATLDRRPEAYHAGHPRGRRANRERPGAGKCDRSEFLGADPAKAAGARPLARL